MGPVKNCPGTWGETAISATGEAGLFTVFGAQGNGQALFPVASDGVSTCVDTFTNLPLNFGLAGSIAYPEQNYHITPLSLLTLSATSGAVTIPATYWDVYNRWVNWAPYGVTSDYLTQTLKIDVTTAEPTALIVLGSAEGALGKIAIGGALLATQAQAYNLVSNLATYVQVQTGNVQLFDLATMARLAAKLQGPNDAAGLAQICRDYVGEDTPAKVSANAAVVAAIIGTNALLEANKVQFLGLVKATTIDFDVLEQVVMIVRISVLQHTLLHQAIHDAKYSSLPDLYSDATPDLLHAAAVNISAIEAALGLEQVLGPLKITGVIYNGGTVSNCAGSFGGLWNASASQASLVTDTDGSFTLATGAPGIFTFGPSAGAGSCIDSYTKKAVLVPFVLPAPATKAGLVALTPAALLTWPAFDDVLLADNGLALPTPELTNSVYTFLGVDAAAYRNAEANFFDFTGLTPTVKVAATATNSQLMSIWSSALTILTIVFPKTNQVDITHVFVGNTWTVLKAENAGGVAPKSALGSPDTFYKILIACVVDLADMQATTTRRMWRRSLMAEATGALPTGFEYLSELLTSTAAVVAESNAQLGAIVAQAADAAANGSLTFDPQVAISLASQIASVQQSDLTDALLKIVTSAVADPAGFNMTAAAESLSANYTGTSFSTKVEKAYVNASAIASDTVDTNSTGAVVTKSSSSKELIAGTVVAFVTATALAIGAVAYIVIKKRKRASAYEDNGADATGSRRTTAQNVEVGLENGPIAESLERFNSFTSSFEHQSLEVRTPITWPHTAASAAKAHSYYMVRLEKARVADLLPR